MTSVMVDDALRILHADTFSNRSHDITFFPRQIIPSYALVDMMSDLHHNTVRSTMECHLRRQYHHQVPVL